VSNLLSGQLAGRASLPGEPIIVKGEMIMFARIVELAPKAEERESVVNVLRKEILPILKNQPGFLEILPFTPEIKPEKMIAVTLWTDKKDAIRYEREVYPKVEAILKPYLAEPIVCKFYHVETALCQHFVAALAA
jgi:quinol monooxygenase YgiN